MHSCRIANMRKESLLVGGWWLAAILSLSLSLSLSRLFAAGIAALSFGERRDLTQASHLLFYLAPFALSQRERETEIYVDVAFPRLFFFQSLPFFLFVHAVLKCKFRKGRSRVLKKAISSSSMSSLHVLLFLNLWGRNVMFSYGSWFIVHLGK